MKVLVLASSKAEAKTLDIYITVITGTGLVQAAAAASYAIAEHKPDVIVSAGSAGSFGRFQIGDIVSFGSVICPDNDLTRFGLAKGTALRADGKKLSILPLSGNTDYILSSSSSFESGQNRLIGNIRPDASDMEAYGAAYAAFLKGIPCFAIKMITDIIGEDLRLPDYTSRLCEMRDRLPGVIEENLALL